MDSSVLAKAFQIIEALAREPNGCGLGVLAERVGMTKPTVHRILRNLSNLGYAERSGQGVYRLTTKLRQVATRQDDGRLLAAGEVSLARLHEETGETVNLGVLRGDRVVYLAVLESKHPLRRVAQAQSSDPFHTTALGRSMVAFLPADRRERLLATAKIERRTSRTITDKRLLAAVLDRARENGYAFELDETDLGVMCIGAPIFENDQPVAAVSISVPSARVDEKSQKRLTAAIVRCTKEITSNLNQFMKQTPR